MTEKILIVAHTENQVIGKNNQMPWHLPRDLQHFKRTTMGYPVIMGRKSYQSMGKALPHRENHVISRQQDLQLQDAQVHTTPEAAFKACEQAEKVFLIGGATLYAALLPQMDRVIITHIHTTLAGDAFFPLLSPLQWRAVSRETWQKDEKNAYDMSIVEYLRI